MCRDLKCLPGPGALLDQDSLMIYAIDLVVDATNARQKLESDQRAAERRRAEASHRR